MARYQVKCQSCGQIFAISDDNELVNFSRDDQKSKFKEVGAECPNPKCKAWVSTTIPK